MKALVLSGGSGTRLRPFSHSRPKQLIPVANKPVLEYVLENVRDLGVREVGVIVAAGGGEIAAEIGDGSRLGLDLTYLEQDEPLGLAQCVSLARDFLGDDDFVMYLGDNMLPDGVAGAAADFARERPGAQVLVARVPDPREFGIVELDAAGAVLRLLEKPADPPSDLALIGVYFFTPAVHAAVEGITPSARGELEITDAIQWLLEHGAGVHATVYDGYWKDTGRPEDVLACNRRVLDDLVPGLAGTVDAESVIGPKVRIDRGATVLRSRIDGPAVIGAGTVIEDSRIGPYTAIGRDCTLSGADVAGSIVLDGATVADVGDVRESLIGRSATVLPADEGDTSNRLLVGDHTRVEIVA